ncbi:amino acid ABC transporter permease [Hansschlegelia beijingensis]|uniref:amino acid ABC transporter permease n=1 Tax=Hansschlegelia beijingensis TaxID=1133344 RepID=UPI00387F166C
MTPERDPSFRPMAVLLPLRPREPEPLPRITTRHSLLFVTAVLLIATVAHAQAPAAPVAAPAAEALTQAPATALTVIIKWLPLLMKGFLFNILISVLAMALGTVAGLMLGLAQISQHRWLRQFAWVITQFFRNAPWLVLLFFAMFMIPYQFTVFGYVIPFPDWVKAIIGFGLPVMANVAELLRGAIRSIPNGQWEAAESLAFSRNKTLWLIILPQCVKRMLPPWMNLYSLITMATVMANLVGVSEMLTLTAEVHAAEGGRPELLAPLYGFAMLCFFVYCWPIDRATQYLERRFHVKT